MLPSRLLEDVEDFVDVRGALARCLASVVTFRGPELLDFCERTLEELTDLEVEAAFALNVRGLTGAVRTHAYATRWVGRTQASLARAGAGVLCPHMRKTPKPSAPLTGALWTTDSANPSALRVSRGSMMASS